jgi:hypothetical protein
MIMEAVIRVEEEFDNGEDTVFLSLWHSALGNQYTIKVTWKDIGAINRTIRDGTI